MFVPIECNQIVIDLVWWKCAWGENDVTFGQTSVHYGNCIPVHNRRINVTHRDASDFLFLRHVGCVTHFPSSSSQYLYESLSKHTHYYDILSGFRRFFLSLACRQQPEKVLWKRFILIAQQIDLTFWERKHTKRVDFHLSCHRYQSVCCSFSVLFVLSKMWNFKLVN